MSTGDERAAARREAQERRERRNVSWVPALEQVRAERDVLLDLVTAAHHLIGELTGDLPASSQESQRSAAWDVRAREAIATGAGQRGTISFGELTYQVRHLELTGGALRIHGLADIGTEGSHLGRGELRGPDGLLVWKGLHTGQLGTKSLKSQWVLTFDASGSPVFPPELRERIVSDIDDMGSDAPLSFRQLWGYLAAPEPERSSDER